MILYRVLLYIGYITCMLGVCAAQIKAPLDATQSAFAIHSHQPAVYHIYIGGNTPVYHNTPALLAPSMTNIDTVLNSGGLSWWQRLKLCCIDRPKELLLSINLHHASWWSYIMAHKWSLSIKALACLYCWVNYRLFSMNTYLTDTSRWNYWSQRFSVSQLMRMSPHDIIAEMVERASLSQRYVLSERERVKDIIAEIEHELSVLQYYHSYASMLHSIDAFQRQCGALCETLIPSLGGISWGCFTRQLVHAVGVRSFFYLNHQLLDRIPECIDRLQYLKELLGDVLNRPA